jgi:oxygen-independent coproporphyrinogen-3 oxidase
MALGVYISVPFCRTKCSYCNFASDVFSRAAFQRYVDRVCADIENAGKTADEMGGRLERTADSIYLGGGTPTILDPAQLEQIFAVLRREFSVLPGAEVTVECAPGTLAPGMLEGLLRCGVNRVSLGVQSFVDQEAAAVGRLHNRSTVNDDIASLRAAGISNINVDLIAGLPHQTANSWQTSLQETVVTAAPHVSVYMLEVDEDSRLGREVIAGGTRYHAHFVPDDDATADFYLAACEALAGADIRQYEISNFSRPGFESRHNLKYWTRQPYFGFGVDAHSMLNSFSSENDSVRFSTPDSLDQYMSAPAWRKAAVSRWAAIEEMFFLGLRLNRGVDLRTIGGWAGHDALRSAKTAIARLAADGLMDESGDIVRLTARGRLLSNEVFQSFLVS